MSIPLLLAGLLCLIAAPAHLYGGEYVLRRVSTQAFPQIPNGDASIAKQELRFGWHMVTVDLLLSGLLLVWFGLSGLMPGQQGILIFIAAHFLGYAIVIVLLPVLALRRIEPLYRSPQWLLCLLVAGLTFAGISGV